MNRTKLSIMLLLASVALSTVAQPAKDPAKRKAAEEALAGFAGTWDIEKVTPEGAAKEAKRLVFKKDRTYAAQDAAGKDLWAGTYELDPSGSPKIWDHRSHEAKATGGDALGIYELNGDALKVACVVGQWKGTEWTGKPRPTGFDPTKADVVIELKRLNADKP